MAHLTATLLRMGFLAARKKSKINYIIIYGRFTKRNQF